MKPEKTRRPAADVKKPRTAREADALRWRLTARLIALRCKPAACADARCRRRAACRRAAQMLRRADELAGPAPSALPR